MTKTYVKQAIEKLNREIFELSDNPNPQVKKEVIKMVAELQTFEAVLASLEGNHVLLRIYTI